MGNPFAQQGWEDTYNALGRVPTSALGGLYSSIHGVHSNQADQLGISAGTSTAWNGINRATPNRQAAPGLLGAMYPRPPLVNTLENIPHGSSDAYAGLGGEVYATRYRQGDFATMAHEYEHTAQRNTRYDFQGQWPAHYYGLRGHLAAEIGPTILGNIFPQATYQSNNPSVLARQPPNGLAAFNENYQPSLTWLHNQAQQHGVFGPTPMAQSLGYTGNQPQSITGLIGNNPQWIGAIAGYPIPTATKQPGLLPPQPVRPQQYGLRGNLPMRPKPMPDLKGYLP